MKKGDVKGTRLFNEKTKEDKKFKQLVDEFILNLRIKNRAEPTITSYKYHTKYFKEFLGEDVYCKDIIDTTIEDYILYLQNERKIENAITINSYLQNISPVIKYGYKKGYMEDIEIPYLKVQETFKEIYSQDDLEKLLEKPKKKDFLSLRTWAILWTFASTGIRSTELRNLKVKNVDIINRTITVNHTKNKKARYLPISYSLLEVLQEYLKVRNGEGDDFLFPTVYNDMMASSSLTKLVTNQCRAKKVNKTSLHLFRHTFITNAVNKNVSPLILQNITGHSSMKELNRYYNAKTVDIVNVIDDIAPKKNKKESFFKKGVRKQCKNQL